MQVPPFSLEKQILELQSEIENAVLKVIHSGKYIGGEEVQAFEKAFASYLDVPYLIGCNSGTDALILALRALDIGPGDEVITPSFSFFATAEAISNVGAKPVFVEVDQNNYLINYQQIRNVITSATKAIMPVHLFGCPADMEQLLCIAKEYNLKVIEDCAQAAGARWKGKAVGSWGDIGCFSFFPTKNLGAAGDGGAVSTHDSALARRMKELAVHGMPERYLHTELGYNSRLDAIQAAILNVKLPKLDYWIKKRTEIANRYANMLKDFDDIEIPVFAEYSNFVHSWNQFVVRIKNFQLENSNFISDNMNIIRNNNLESSLHNSRSLLKLKLEEHGINTIIYYPKPIHLQPAYKELSYKIGSMPVTESLCDQVLSLPIFPEMRLDQQEYVVTILRKLYNL